jgi:hypothetical protein
VRLASLFFSAKKPAKIINNHSKLYNIFGHH